MPLLNSSPVSPTTTRVPKPSPIVGVLWHGGGQQSTKETRRGGVEQGGSRTDGTRQE